MEYKDYELLIRDLIDKKNNAIDEKEKEIIRNKIRANKQKMCLYEMKIINRIRVFKIAVLELKA